MYLPLHCAKDVTRHNVMTNSIAENIHAILEENSRLFYLEYMQMLIIAIFTIRVFSLHTIEVVGE